MVEAGTLLIRQTQNGGALQVERGSGNLDAAVVRARDLLVRSRFAVALVSSPTEYRVLALTDLYGDVSEAQIADAFEVRIFGPEGEVRWVRDGDAGRYVVLRETESPAGDVELAFVATNDIRYLMWGTGTGGMEVAEQRIGSIPLPFTVPSGAQVVVNAREYVTVDAHGNAAVAEERLIDLEVTP